MNETAVSLNLLLEFEATFPDERKLSIEQYLAGSSKSMILKIATFFLGFKGHHSIYEDNELFLTNFFQQDNNSLANQIFCRIKELEKDGRNVSIINTISSLRLFEYYFSKTEEIATQSEAEFEVNLFKAYLVLNSEFMQKQSIAFKYVPEIGHELCIPMMIFCMHYPLSDKTSFDINQIWMTQIIKSNYLFQFLETNQTTKPILNAFLAYFHCTTWQEYLKNIISLTLPIFQNKNEAHTDLIIQPNKDFNQICDFIEKLIVTDNDDLDPNDFLSVRAKPFYKIKDGVYRIIFNLFVVEKIFKGVYFFLRDINKSLPQEIKIKEIKSFYGDEFSEKILCYQVINSIYTKYCTRFSGNELSNMKMDAAPDYYIKKGKNILLFESKDFLIPADIKMSFNFKEYEKAFQKVLYYEAQSADKVKPKAVLQLINNIRRLLRKEFIADTNYFYKDIFIYPILLTHDHQYDTPGFNELINYWFQQELLKLKEEGLYIYHVKPLTVVNIDSLIYNQAVLADSIQLHKLLDLYSENKKIIKRKYTNLEDLQKEYFTKILPFSLFISRYVEKHHLHKPPSLKDILSGSLFKYD